VRGSVRDHIISRKNNRGPSYRRCEALQRWSSPNINIREIFGAFRFFTFATASAQSGSRTSFIQNCAFGALEAIARALSVP
jgi:hypothetical protein